MISRMFTRRGGQKVHVLQVDVGELPDLKNFPVIPENQEIQRKLTLKWGLREREPGEQNDDSAPRSFYLGRLKDIHAVDRRLQKGWKNGSEKALELADGLMDQISQPLSIRRKLRWSDNGDEFDRERLNDGHLDTCWRTTHRQIAVAVPVITIAMSWGCNANTSHDQFFWSGAAALALCRVLEYAGYQTSLTAIEATTHSLYDPSGIATGGSQALCVTVKSAGEYMRSDALASVVCMGETFRTYGFMGTYCVPFKISDGLGSHSSIEDLMPEIIESGAMDVPQITLPDSRSKESAQRAIENALNELKAANLAALPEIRG